MVLSDFFILYVVLQKKIAFIFRIFHFSSHCICPVVNGVLLWLYTLCIWFSLLFLYFRFLSNAISKWRGMEGDINLVSVSFWCFRLVWMLNHAVPLWVNGKLIPIFFWESRQLSQNYSWDSYGNVHCNCKITCFHGSLTL